MSDEEMWDQDGLPTHPELLAHEDTLKTEQFLEALRVGVGEKTAALAVGWSPAKLKEKLRDRGFGDLVALYKDLEIEAVEQAVYELAVKSKHFQAMQFYLLCKAPHRGWRPPQQRVAVQRHEKISVEIVGSAKQTLKELVGAGGSMSIADLQPGGALDQYIDVESEEVDVDDDDGIPED